MHAEPLFFEPETLEKTAGEVDLPEDPNQWPQEILQELYKQVPYISDYQPHVEMQKVDGEQGYGIGHVEIKNETEAPEDTDAAMMEASGLRVVRIPFVINNKKLSPFDLLLTDDSKMLPLTENRLRQAIFRPQAFDVTSKTPGDQAMVGQLYPPYRQNYGMGGGGMMMGGMGAMKTGSALEEYLLEGDEEVKEGRARWAKELGKELKSGDMGKAVKGFTKKVTGKADLNPNYLMATQKGGVGASGPARDMVRAAKEQVKAGSILDAILPTIGHADHERFCDEMMKSAAWVRLGTPAIIPALQKVVETEPSSLAKMASWEGLVRPTVAQIQRSPSGYIVKEASHLLWDPKSSLVSRGEVVERFGVKIAADVDTTGSVTVAEGATAEGGDTQTNLAPVQTFGLYKVRDEDGKEHVGFVVPSLIDADGTAIPLQLFTNGTVTATQSEILGEPAGSGGNLPSGPVGGHGAFYTVDAEGAVQMTIPFELSDSYTMPGEPAVFSGETFDGRPVEVSVQPNISGVMSTEEGRLLVPDSWAWIPLGNALAVPLVGGDENIELETEEEQAEKESHVIVRGSSGGETFSFSGVPVEKLARDERVDLDVAGAMFLLAGLGTHQGYGAEKLAEAAYSDAPVSIKTGRALRLKGEMMKQAHEEAAKIISGLPQLKQPHLIKEAANFPDPSVVDTVLSLGFVNPENILTFVSYLPEIEGVQSKLCEILLGVRLGLQNVPQSSLERAIRSLEEAIEGLKILAFQGS